MAAPTNEPEALASVLRRLLAALWPGDKRQNEPAAENQQGVERQGRNDGRHAEPHV